MRFAQLVSPGVSVWTKLLTSVPAHSDWRLNTSWCPAPFRFTTVLFGNICVTAADSTGGTFWSSSPVRTSAGTFGTTVPVGIGGSGLCVGAGQAMQGSGRNPSGGGTIHPDTENGANWFRATPLVA